MSSGYEEKLLPFVGRVEAELTRRKYPGERGKFSLHSGAFSCTKMVKLVYSVLLHRTAHYGSYDLLGSSSISAKSDEFIGQFGKLRSITQWNGASSCSESSGQGSSPCKASNLTCSLSEDDLIAVSSYRRLRQPSTGHEEDRRSLNVEDILQENDQPLRRRLDFTSLENLPFSRSAESVNDEDQRKRPGAEKKMREMKQGNDKVRNLRLANELGGILDPDDSLLAVVEDKEQIVAIYDEQEPTTSTTTFPRFQGGKTNGYSNNTILAKDQSSLEHATPLTPSIISSKRNGEKENGQYSASTSADTNSVLVDEDSASSGLLVVRRGSEPVLNVVTYPNGAGTTMTTERSRAGLVKKRVEFLNAEKKNKDDPSMSTENSKVSSGRFARTAARKSRLTDEWLEVAAQAAEEFRANQFDNGKHDRHSDEGLDPVRLQQSPSKRPPPAWLSKVRDYFDPAYESQYLKALIVKKVPESETDMIEGKFNVGDRVVEVNGRSVAKTSFESALDHFRRCYESGNPVTLTVNRSSPSRPSSLAYRPPAPVFPLPGEPATKRDEHLSPKMSTGSPASAPMAALQKGNTRRIGQRIVIDLTKKPPPDGFGFTLTSRDNEFTSSGEALVYVKTISPSGAAIEDGRLKAGDRLLEVNGITLDKSFGQREVVGVLRQMKPGDVVSLVVSRQVNVADEEPRQVEKALSPSARGISPSLPRPLKEETDKETISDQKLRSYGQEVLTFDIPLNNTGSAGLGVSVKGRMATNDNGERHDGGIFVKTIMHGGAGHKDGRLRVNDRVVAVEGVDLCGLPNEAAMQRLRSVLMGLKPTAKSIQLTVLRLVPNQRKMDVTNRDGSVSSLSNGGRHRFLVNEKSTNMNGGHENRIHVGDNDYAIVMKNRSLKPALSTLSSVVQWPNSEDDEPPVMIEWPESGLAGHQGQVKASRSDSTGSSLTGDRISRKDIDEEGSVEALFVRDAPTRRSMSEKRHGAAKIDPSSTATYQRIQHQRQTSAPSLQRNKMGPGSSATIGTISVEKTDPVHSDTPAERRSMSMESLQCLQEGTVKAEGPGIMGVKMEGPGGRKKPREGGTEGEKNHSLEKPLLHEEVAQSLHKERKGGGAGVKWLRAKSGSAGRQRSTNDSFQQAVEKYRPDERMEIGVDVDPNAVRPSSPNAVRRPSPSPSAAVSPCQEPFYAQIPHSTTADAITNRSRPVNKEKDRRKSTGSGLSLKNLFRFGSGGKANRPFAVVSPVSNDELRTDAEENYAKMKDGRHRSHERARRHHVDEEILAMNGQLQMEEDEGRHRMEEDERQHQIESQEIARRQHEDEQRRIRLHYERLKEEQLMKQRMTDPRMKGSKSPEDEGSRSHKNSYGIQQKMSTQWKPPIPPTESRLRIQPVMGRDMAVHVQHHRQHSGGTGSTASGSRLHSPAAHGRQYYPPQQQHYYPSDSPGRQRRHLQVPVLVQPHNVRAGYGEGMEQLQVGDTRRVGANKSGPSNKTVSPVPPQSCWFVDGVGGGASVRHHRFYYSSMDGRPSDRSPMYPPTTSTNPSNSIRESKTVNGSRARYTSERVGNSSTANLSTSRGHHGHGSMDHQNGHQDYTRPHHHQHHACTSEAPANGRHHVIIGSIPIFDSRKTDDGVTKIVIDSNGQRIQQHPPPLPPPPPDYEQYLRSRHARKGIEPTRPSSEFIGDAVFQPGRYECSSLPRKGAATKNDELDVIMATPPARNVHYFYHPQQ